MASDSEQRRRLTNAERGSRLSVALGGLLWFALVALGMSRLWQYELTPGRAPISPSQWPVATRLALASDHPTLILLAHPRCPCTRASLAELMALMTRCRAQVNAYVLFTRPAHTPADWEKTGLYAQAAAIPGVHVLSDPEGQEAQHFHAATSGQTLLYDTTGRLLFSGGITGTRGHEGDNPGRQALMALLIGSAPARRRTPVFGCALLAATRPGN